MLFLFVHSIRNKLKEAADSIGLPTFIVADAGRTQVSFSPLYIIIFIVVVDFAVIIRNIEIYYP